MMLMSEVVTAVERSLKECRIAASIELLRNWLSICEPGEPEELLKSCSEAWRPHLAMLLRDVLSRYPSTLLGCPVLVQSAPEMELDCPAPPALVLPFPRPEHSKPCSDLHFIGWLPMNAALPVPFPFRPECYTTHVAWRTPTAVVALFRSHPGALDLDMLEVPGMWWCDLFQNTPGITRLDGKVLFAYPDSLDAAKAMQAGASGKPIPSPGHFLHDMSGMHDFGVRFTEACRTHFQE